MSEPLRLQSLKLETQIVPKSRGDRALADLFDGTAKVQQAGDEPITLAIEQGRALACTAQQDGAFDLFQGDLVDNRVVASFCSAAVKAECTQARAARRRRICPT